MKKPFLTRLSFKGRFCSEGAGKIFQFFIMPFMWTKNWPEPFFPVNVINKILIFFWIDQVIKSPHYKIWLKMQIIWVSLIVCNACKAKKLLIITWIHICTSLNKLIWSILKNEKSDILSLLFMPFTGNKSPGTKKGSDEWHYDNFTNIFWVKRTFIYFAGPV